MGPTFSDIMEGIRGLDTESKQELLDAVHAWVVEERRETILREAAETEKELQGGHAKCGTLSDLKADLYSDD
jgi:hypothetical protein